MFFQALAIARNAFVESIRQPIFLLLVVLSGFLQVFNTWNSGFSMGQGETSEVSGDDKLLFDIGLSTVFVFGMLLAAFIATSVMSREIENKTVLTVVSKPVARSTLVIGKYFGVSGAILVATFTMLIFLLLGLRHGVMSTAADELDKPVIYFSALGLFISIGVAAWCNFFYGWSFPQVATVLLLPAFFVVYVLVLLIGKKWELQPLLKDFKPQVALACVCLIMVILVLTAVATAASTRLGQVMTIAACALVFVGSLLSNYLLGRHAYHNSPVGLVQEATPNDPTRPILQRAGDRYTVMLKQDPKTTIVPGASFYYGPNPNGSALAVRSFPPFAGNVADSASALDPNLAGAIVVEASNGRKLTVEAIGNAAGLASRPPESGDFVFLNPTHITWPTLLAWGVLPNLQSFWLLDAVSQNQPVPATHIGLVALYGVVQVAAFLCLAVILFQKRDVG